MKLEKKKLTYTQEGDCCGGGDLQFLEVETHDGGGGHFITITTERWAIDAKDIDAFVATLKCALGGMR